MISGYVEAFDDHRGDGVVRSDLGEAFYFHCVSIADGSRSIAVGQVVTAQRGVGHLGRDQAFDLRITV